MTSELCGRLLAVLWEKKDLELNIYELSWPWGAAGARGQHGVTQGDDKPKIRVESILIWCKFRSCTSIKVCRVGPSQ